MWPWSEHKPGTQAWYRPTALTSNESAGGKVILLKHIKGCHRPEFDAVSDAKRPCDLSPFIHSNPDQTDSSGASPGYMLQFGAGGKE